MHVQKILFESYGWQSNHIKIKPVSKALNPVALESCTLTDLGLRAQNILLPVYVKTKEFASSFCLFVLFVSFFLFLVPHRSTAAHEYFTRYSNCLAKGLKHTWVSRKVQSKEDGKWLVRHFRLLKAHFTIKRPEQISKARTVNGHPPFARAVSVKPLKVTWPAVSY